MELAERRWFQVLWVCTGSIALILMFFSLAGAMPAHAQQLDPTFAVQAYTTADPNNPDRFGLATPDGRFSITPIQGCDWLAVGQDVNVYPNWQLPPWLGVSGTDATSPGCAVRVEGRMDTTPCFTDDTGVCDVAAEAD